MTAGELIEALQANLDYTVIVRGYEAVTPGRNAELVSVVKDKERKTYIVGVVEGGEAVEEGDLPDWGRIVDVAAPPVRNLRKVTVRNPKPDAPTTAKQKTKKPK